MKNNRFDYEHQELDNDGCYYFFTNRDVDIKPYPTVIKEIYDWFRQEEAKYREKSLYYKGTRLYFTYEGDKFYFTWTFYGDELIKEAVQKLKKAGVTNIQINWGELD